MQHTFQLQSEKLQECLPLIAPNGIMTLFSYFNDMQNLAERTKEANSRLPSLIFLPTGQIKIGKYL